MNFLIDISIISEVRKGERCDVHVLAWYASIADEDLFLGTLVLREIRKGIELARPRHPDEAAALERWLRQVEAGFDGCVLGIDHAASDQWGPVSTSAVSTAWLGEEPTASGAVSEHAAPLCSDGRGTSGEGAQMP